MAFTLVYTAEHYVVDILLGWALTAVVITVTHWLEARRAEVGTRAERTASFVM
jgi:hypothetical protein